MRFPAALLLAFVTVPALARSAELGLAESRSGLWCLATGAEKVAPGTELLLYEPYQGIRASARVAQDAGEGCGELKSRFIWPRQPDAPAFFYRIEPRDPGSTQALAGAGALFAVLDAPEAAPGLGIDLEGDGTPERFRICTSGEGLHFVVEGGEAVLWHAYYHLGLDVEPDCPDRIYAE